MVHCRGCGDVIGEEGGDLLCGDCQPHQAPKNVRFKNDDSGGHGNVAKGKSKAQPVQTVAAIGQAPSLELTRNLITNINPILPRFTQIELEPYSGNLNASVNQYAVKCYICGEWFSDQSALRFHYQRFDCGCEQHGDCFASHEAYVHAQRYDHVRCFVPTCTSKYRYETGWQSDKVKAHIREAHYPKGDKR